LNANLKVITNQKEQALKLLNKFQANANEE
jgi:hypothetical protein